MDVCDQCRNEYDKCFQVIKDGKTYTFDCLECAIQLIAPRCAHCGIRIIGHGVESNGLMFCCANCAQHLGIEGLKDRKYTTQGDELVGTGL